MDIAFSCFTNLREQLLPSMCQSTVSLSGKTVIVTGAGTGIGKETARDLAKRGAKVIIACMDLMEGDNAKQDICKTVNKADVVVKFLDLASFKSIRKFAEEILNSEPYIHILINNAGTAFCPKSKTEDGFEKQFGVNYLGHFLLTTLLLDRIKSSAPARIVNVASLAYIWGEINFSDINMEHNYSSWSAYCQSKLANMLFTRELAKRLKGTGVTTYSVNPGVVHTDMCHSFISSWNKLGVFASHIFFKLFMKLPYQGAQTSIYCAVEKSIASESGYYYSNCCKALPSATATDDDTARKLWDMSENLILSYG